MLEIEKCEGLVRIRAGATLEAADYDRFVPTFERMADRTSDEIPMVIELASDFSGWDLGGLAGSEV